MLKNVAGIYSQYFIGRNCLKYFADIDKYKNIVQ